MMYGDRFNINLKKAPGFRSRKDYLRYFISETGIGIDQAIVEVISKPPPPISAQQIPPLLDFNISRF